MKKLMLAHYSQTVPEMRSLEKFLHLTLNWLPDAEMISIDARKLSSCEVKKLTTSITSNYVVYKNITLHITFRKNYTD